MKAAGNPVPDLDARVRPLPHLVWIWNAFWQLSGDRQVGFGLGPLPFTAIDCYARRYAIDGDRFDRLESLLRAMDGGYLAKVRAQT